MSLELVLVAVIALANFTSMLHFGLYLVGANMYDIWRHIERTVTTRRPARPTTMPLVSVIVPAHNEAISIARTLDSIRSSSYKNLEIIVVDDGSTDDTARLVQDYIFRLSAKPLSYLGRHGRSGRLLRRKVQACAQPLHTKLLHQDNQGKGAALNNGIRQSRGELIMCLDADSLLHVRAIEHAVSYFKYPRIVGVAANVRVAGTGGWLDLLQRFEHMIGYRSKKFYSLTGTEFVVGGVASTYRRSTLWNVGLYDTDTMTEDIGLSLKVIDRLGNRDKRIVYAADVVALTQGVQTFRQLIRQRYRWKMGMLQNLYKYRHLFFHHDHTKYSRLLTTYRLPMSMLSELLLLLTPFIFSFLLYVSIARRTLTIFLGAYLTITLYTLCNLWADEHFPRAVKFRMSLLALFMYLLFYTMDVVQLVAGFRCIRHYRQIRGDKAQVVWTSPDRSRSPRTELLGLTPISKIS